MSSAATTTPRSVLLDPDEQRVIEEQRVRRLHCLARREAWSFVVFTAGLLVAAVLMAILIPSDRTPGLLAWCAPSPGPSLAPFSTDVRGNGNRKTCGNVPTFHHRSNREANVRPIDAARLEELLELGPPARRGPCPARSLRRSG